MNERVPALVIGGGPAGLMAAERLIAAGFAVVLCDSMPTVGRKFLMAGKSGLNLTKRESAQTFESAYTDAASWLRPMLDFGPQQIEDWARDLGQEVFVGSSGRVFPVAMKASPLLRAWLRRLSDGGLEVRTGWKWLDHHEGTNRFATAAGERCIKAATTVLALGGASWARLGSDGAWARTLAGKRVPLAPFRPANMGFGVRWSAHMKPHFGKPIKPLALIAGDTRQRGEIVISEQGLEGGGLYTVSALLRDGAGLILDLIPDVTHTRATALLTHRSGRETASRALTKAFGLDPVRVAVAMEFGRPWPNDPEARAALIKALPVPLGPPQPIDRAISTAGGVMASGLTAGLMLKALPGVFAAGEMLDWEAPTGGYLLTACLATGRHAGDSAAAWLTGRAGTEARNEISPGNSHEA